MTLDEALAIAHPWLGTSEQEIPMPPASDELAMQVLRKLRKVGKLVSFGPWIDRTADYAQEACSITIRDSLVVMANADDPRDAIIIAAATWLQSQEKQKG